MKLAIVRHGQAETLPPTEDRERALTDRGCEDVGHVAQSLARHDLGRIKIICSPYARTKQTASLLGEKLSAPSPEPVRELSAGVTARLAINVGVDYSDDVDTLIMVGHAPDVSDVLAMLLPKEEVCDHSFSPGCCAFVETPGELRPRKGKLLAFYDPKALPSTS